MSSEKEKARSWSKCEDKSPWESEGREECGKSFRENGWAAGLRGDLQTALRLWIWNLAHLHGCESATGSLQVQCKKAGLYLIRDLRVPAVRTEVYRGEGQWKGGLSVGQELRYWRAGRGRDRACGEFLRTPLLWPGWAILRPVEVKIITVSYDGRVGRIPCVHIEIAGDQREAGMSTEPTFLLKVMNDTYSKNAQWSESL